MYVCKYVCMYEYVNPLLLCHYTHLKYVTDKYGCYIAIMSHTAILVNRHIDPKLLHKYIKTQPTAISNSQVITTYVPTKYAPQMAQVCDLCKSGHVQIAVTYVIIYASYECTAVNNQKYWYTYISHLSHMPVKGLLSFFRKHPWSSRKVIGRDQLTAGRDYMKVRNIMHFSGVMWVSTPHLNQYLRAESIIASRSQEEVCLHRASKRGGEWWPNKD